MLYVYVLLVPLAFWCSVLVHEPLICGIMPRLDVY